MSSETNVTPTNNQEWINYQDVQIMRSNRRREHIIQMSGRNLMDEFNRTDWKNLAIKMDYLLKEMIRMGGTNENTNPNIAPILDLYHDLGIPHISEVEKETAGVPSTLTNTSDTVVDVD